MNTGLTQCFGSGSGLIRRTESRPALEIMRIRNTGLTFYLLAKGSLIYSGSYLYMIQCFGSRIGFNSDPNPAFFVNADPNLHSHCGSGYETLLDENKTTPLKTDYLTRLQKFKRLIMAIF
jgi:hypothetical protein